MYKRVFENISLAYGEQAFPKLQHFEQFWIGLESLSQGFKDLTLRAAWGESICEGTQDCIVSREGS